MADTFEQDIILDADGHPVFSALDYVNAEVAKLQRTISQIGKDSYSNVADVGKVIASQTKELQQALSQLRTLTSAKAQSGNTAGPLIQDLNAEKRLAGATVAATAYARSLSTAASSGEALRAKLSELDREAAARGRLDQAETLTNSRKRAEINEQIAQLRSLDTELARLDRRAGRTSGTFGNEQAAIVEARARLQTAALTPGRVDLQTPLAEVTAAQDAYALALDRTRRKQAEALVESRAYYRQLEADALKAREAIPAQIASTFTDRDKAAASAAALARTRASDYDKALAAVSVTTTPAGKASQEAQMWAANAAAARRATAEEVAGENEVAAAQRARFEQDSIQDAARVRNAKGVGAARLEAARAGVIERARAVQDDLTLTREQAQSQDNLRRLRAEAKNAGTDPERRAELAQLIELERTYNNELTKVSRSLNAQREAASRRFNVDQGKADGALTDNFARGSISSLGVDGARAAAKQRILELEERLIGAEAGEKAELTALLSLEQRRAAAIERQGNAAAVEDRKSVGGRFKTAITNTALYGAVAGIGYGAFNQAQQAVTDVVQLEDEMAKLQAISNSTDTQMQSLKGTIFAIGETSRFSTVDIAKIAQTLAQAGVTATDMGKVLRSVTTLATASGSTPDEAVQLVTSALGAFQLQASEAGRIADLLTNALNRTKLTVGQVGEAIQYVGATAYEQNISLEQVLATIGAIAQAGVKSGSSIGTGFRQFLIDLSTPSEKLTAQLKLLGLSAADVDVSVRGLPAVLDTLKQAGFGAGQAYQGLETRAAAFYLVAKNNIDVMDQLELSFANTGAAAVANERAMNSLTAQWTRFKNVVEEKIESSIGNFTNDVKEALSFLSDLISKYDEWQKRGALTGYIADKVGGAGSSNALANYGKNVQDHIENTSIYLNNAIGFKFFDETAARARIAAKATAELGDQSDLLATQMANTSDKVDAQKNKISELDKEMERLITQKATLSTHDARTAAETVTLTSRFQGLAVYLDNTKTRYESLTGAVAAYRNAQLGLLNSDLFAQQSQLSTDTHTAARSGGAAINSLLNDKGAQSIMTPADRVALQTLRTAQPGTQESIKAQGILSGDIDRLTGINAEVGDKVNQVVQAAAKIAQNVAIMSANRSQIGDNAAAATPVGQSLTALTGQVTSLITQLGSADRTDKTSLGKQGNALIAQMSKIISNSLNKNPTSSERTYLQNQQGDLKGLTQQISALLAPTKAEIKDAKAQEREAEKRPFVQQSDIDALGTSIGLALGRGHDESPAARAREDILHAAGKTSATGLTSGHTAPGELGRDFVLPKGTSDAAGEQAAELIRSKAKAQGIDAYIKYENGKGKNNGTGPHVHVSTRPNTRFGKDRTGQTDDQYRSELAQDQLSLDEADLKDKLAEISKASTQATFDTAVGSAKSALDKVNKDLTDAAKAELDKKGYAEGSPQYKAKMLQVNQAVQQNITDFQNKIADATVKSVDLQLKAVQRAFEDAIRPAQSAQAVAEARVSGLDYISNDGLVPDYVKTLASRRAAQAKENTDRATLANLPTEIAGQQAALDNLNTRQQAVAPDTAAYDTLQAKIEAVTASMAALQTQRDSLAAALGAGNQIPTSLTEGLQQAIDAYTQVNHLNNTFAQDLTLQLGGAIDTVGQGLETMFSSIITGSQNALQAFGNFAKSIIQYMAQIVAKALASKVLSLLLNLAGTLVGGGVAGGGGNSAGIGEGISTSASSAAVPFYSFNGGPAFPGQGLLKGGEVVNGSDAQDSVTKKIAKGEWVVNKKAVDSVGNGFMAQLNAHGAAALSALQQTPQIKVAPKQEMAVYVVQPNTKPQLGKNDILLAVQEDVLAGGETKKLIKYVAQGN